MSLNVVTMKKPMTASATGMNKRANATAAVLSTNRRTLSSDGLSLSTLYSLVSSGGIKLRVDLLFERVKLRPLIRRNTIRAFERGDDILNRRSKLLARLNHV